jgi:uncharacterized protein YggT (Ycf19 family)
MTAEGKIDAHIDICVVRYEMINARLKRLEHIVIATAGFIIILLLGLVLSGWTLLFLFRIVLTWYPQIDLTKGVMRLIGTPTEPLLALTRRLIQPIGGVDVTPVVWVPVSAVTVQFR